MEFDTSKPVPFETVEKIGIAPILERAFKTFKQKKILFSFTTRKQIRQLSAKATAWSSWHNIKVSTELGPTHFIVYNHGIRTKV